MLELFRDSFWIMAEALGQIFVIVIIAGFLVRKNIFPDEYVKGLSLLTVNILLPAMIFANTVEHFKPEEQPGWWLLPLAGVAMAIVGLLLGASVFVKTLNTNRDVVAVAAFQNAGYLILPIGKFVFPAEFDEFSLYVFLFIMGFNLMLWSVGKYLLRSRVDNAKLKFSDLITIPLVANVISVTIVLAGLRNYVPDILIQPVGLIGSATVPIATFVLGATIGTVSLKGIPVWHIVVRTLFVKLFLVAGLTTLILYHTNLPQTNPLICNLLVMEAAAAPAANILVMVRTFGGDRQKMGALMLFGYIASLVTMPLWVALWAIL